MRSYTSLTDAAMRARSRPPNTVALILGLEGHRYYVFFSQPNLGQLMNRVATRMVSVGMEIEHHRTLQNLGDNELLRPSQILMAQNQQLQPDHNIRRQRTEKLTPHLLKAAGDRNVTQIPGHAEMFMILEWRQCVQDFLRERGRSPRNAEIFLTQSPCRINDENPSPELIIDGFLYPPSCRAKLYTFFKKNPLDKGWKVWYALRFGSAEGVSDHQLAQDFPGIQIGRMEPTVLHLFT